jgi:N-acetylglucosamine kinase-like BadF-type ATPase
LTYLCVGGGQTKSVVVLMDEGGGELEAWRVGPLTTPSKPGATDNLRAVVRSIAGEVERITQKSLHGPPEAACFSLTGYMEGDEAIPAVIRGKMQVAVPGVSRIHVVPDYVGNWAAATGGAPGVMVIRGGGSVAYGRTGSGKALRIGGWGYVLGDEGSGFWIGLEAIKAALKSRVGVIPETALGECIMREFATQDDRRVIREVCSATFSEAEITGLLPLVASISQEGDAVATRILDEAAGHLSDIVRAMLRRLGDLAVYPSWGVFRATTMRERFEEALKRSGTS